MSKNGSAYHRLLNSARWRALRSWQLSRRPLCEDCMRKGIYTSATEVHHIRPIPKRSTPEAMELAAFDKGNLASLCRACHTQRHIELKSHKRGADALQRAKQEAEEFWRRLD